MRSFDMCAYTLALVLLVCAAGGQDGPILTARCASLDAAKRDTESFCKEHQSGDDIAACTDSLASAIWDRCESWLDSGNGGMIHLPVKFETDPSKTCAMNVVVDNVDHCIFTQERAASMLPSDIGFQSNTRCVELHLNDDQCNQLTDRMLNVS